MASSQTPGPIQTPSELKSVTTEDDEFFQRQRERSETHGVLNIHLGAGMSSLLQMSSSTTTVPPAPLRAHPASVKQEPAEMDVSLDGLKLGIEVTPPPRSTNKPSSKKKTMPTRRRNSSYTPSTNGNNYRLAFTEQVKQARDAGLGEVMAQVDLDVLPVPKHEDDDTSSTAGDEPSISAVSLDSKEDSTSHSREPSTNSTSPPESWSVNGRPSSPSEAARWNSSPKRTKRQLEHDAKREEMKEMVERWKDPKWQAKRYSSFRGVESFNAAAMAEEEEKEVAAEQVGNGEKDTALRTQSDITTIRSTHRTATGGSPNGVAVLNRNGPSPSVVNYYRGEEFADKFRAVNKNKLGHKARLVAGVHEVVPGTFSLRTIPRFRRAHLPPGHTAALPFRQIDALPLLFKGAAFLKFGRLGAPHFRLIRLSLDLQRVEWSSQGKKGERAFVSVSEIQSLRLGQTTVPFETGKAPRELALASFSVIYQETSTGKRRSLDLIAKDANEFEVWTQGLRALVAIFRMKKMQADGSIRLASPKKSPVPYNPNHHNSAPPVPSRQPSSHHSAPSIGAETLGPNALAQRAHKPSEPTQTQRQQAENRASAAGVSLLSSFGLSGKPTVPAAAAPPSPAVVSTGSPNPSAHTLPASNMSSSPSSTLSPPKSSPKSSPTTHAHTASAGVPMTSTEPSSPSGRTKRSQSPARATSPSPAPPAVSPTRRVPERTRPIPVNKPKLDADERKARLALLTGAEESDSDRANSKFHEEELAAMFADQGAGAVDKDGNKLTVAMAGGVIGIQPGGSVGKGGVKSNSVRIPSPSAKRKVNKSDLESVLNSVTTFTPPTAAELASVTPNQTLAGRHSQKPSRSVSRNKGNEGPPARVIPGAMPISLSGLTDPLVTSALSAEDSPSNAASEAQVTDDTSIFVGGVLKVPAPLEEKSVDMNVSELLIECPKFLDDEPTSFLPIMRRHFPSLSKMEFFKSSNTQDRTPGTAVRLATRWTSDAPQLDAKFMEEFDALPLLKQGAIFVKFPDEELPPTVGAQAAQQVRPKTKRTKEVVGYFKMWVTKDCELIFMSQSDPSAMAQATGSGGDREKPAIIRIPLREIDEVVVGQTTPSFQKHGAPRQLAAMSFSVLYAEEENDGSSGKTKRKYNKVTLPGGRLASYQSLNQKSIDLVSLSTYAAEAWTEGLSQLLKVCTPQDRHGKFTKNLNDLKSLPIAIPKASGHFPNPDPATLMITNQYGPIPA